MIIRKKPENPETKVFRLFYGDDGDRTRDLQIANLALSQLSYIPTVYTTAAAIQLQLWILPRLAAVVHTAITIHLPLGDGSWRRRPVRDLARPEPGPPSATLSPGGICIATLREARRYGILVFQV